jgi:2,3-bisphosphoglycerate-dependent phosphoglycerate mutase
VATELILIRHGQASRSNGDYGKAPLTPLGREQAVLTGRFLRDTQERLDGFYSSPLRRARETAALIGSEIGREPLVRNGLQEMTFFEFLPTVFLESLARLGLFHEYLYRSVGKPLRWPVLGRVSMVLTELISLHPGQSISLVTHGGVISGVLTWFLPGERGKWWRETVDNCSLTRLSVEGVSGELTLFNGTRHLRLEPPDPSPSQM